MNARDILDHPTVSERYFFPRDDPPDAPWMVAARGAQLVGARAGAHGGAAVLHFHGNGEVVADWVSSPLGRTLDDAGVDVFFGEYRGYGGSTGRPALAAMLDDALAIHDATGVAPRNTIVYGRSVGSLYALHVAAHRPIAGLVIESGIADVLERLLLRVRAEELGSTDDALRDAVHALFDHEAKLAARTCPVLVLHAEHDHLVDPSHAERLARWAGQEAELVLYPRGDHNSIHAANGDDIARRAVALCERVAASR